MFDTITTLPEYADVLGREYAKQVRRGHRTVEEAGDKWVSLADASHEAGEAFIRAYDAAGGPR